MIREWVVSTRQYGWCVFVLCPFLSGQLIDSNVWGTGTSQVVISIAWLTFVALTIAFLTVEFRGSFGFGESFSQAAGRSARSYMWSTAEIDSSSQPDSVARKKSAQNNQQFPCSTQLE
ncbi:MAG: hypothetical protein DHS20C11_14930 [Lysobacteraceae bacterium]|nr:MAG: hypothetical protein DHS20C11_14930 [Xanthomonadaceae bacterium]